MKLTRAWQGRVVVYHGYDNVDYTAHVEKVGKGAAKLLYQVPNRYTGQKDWVTSYLSEKEFFARCA